MNTDEMTRRVAACLPDRFTCSPAPRGNLRVETPLLYPDGGIVDVFVVERDGAWSVTDFGEASGWLEMEADGGSPSPKQARMIEDRCRALGVTNRDGRLELRLTTPNEVGDAVARVARAVAEVAETSNRRR